MVPDTFSVPRFFKVAVIAMQVLLLTGGPSSPLVEAVTPEALSPTAEDLLEEAVGLTKPILSLPQRARLYAEIAVIYSSMGLSKRSQSLFREATEVVGTLEGYDPAKHHERIEILSTIIESERIAGEQEMLAATREKTLAFIQKYSTAKAGAKTNLSEKDRDAKYLSIEKQFGIARMLAQAGEIDRMKTILEGIVQELPHLSREQQGYWSAVASLQARLGEDLAVDRALSEYEAYTKKYSQTSRRFVDPFRDEVFSICAAARQQFASGYEVAAKKTIQKSFSKAKAIPTQEADNSFTDNGRSAGLRTVALSAVEMGMTTLALEALREMTGTAYQGAWSLVIRALAKYGDAATAQKLARDHHCCGDLLALGLAEHGDWEAAVQADQAPEYAGDGDWDRDHNYFRGVAKARVLARGVKTALAWARQKPKEREEKILALIGVAEGISLASRKKPCEEGEKKKVSAPYLSTADY